jgi:hypothetical protein
MLAKKLQLLLCILFLSSFNSAILNANSKACEPSPEVQKVLDQRESKAFVSLPYGAWIRESRKLLQDLARKIPDDLFAQQKYQQSVKWFGSESEHQSMVRSLKDSLAKSPDNPVRLCLYGNALLNPDEAVSYFQKALQRDRSFPLVYHSLASYYYSKYQHEDLKRTLDDWILRCPLSAEPYIYMDTMPDSHYTASKSKKLRSLLKNKDLPETQTAYSTLWALEFATTPPDLYDQIRKQIKDDLLGFGPAESLSIDLLQTLKEGYVLLDDRTKVQQVENDIVRLFPDSEYAADIVMNRWIEEHPDDDDSPQRQAKLLNITTAWMKRWPHNRRVNWWRLEAMELMKDLPKAEIQEAVDRVLKDARETPGGRYPPAEFIAARILIDHRLGLERVGSIIDQGSNSVTDRLRRHAHVYSAEDLNETKDDIRWRADCLRAALAIAMGINSDADDSLN